MVNKIALGVICSITLLSFSSVSHARYYDDYNYQYNGYGNSYNTEDRVTRKKSSKNTNSSHKSTKNHSNSVSFPSKISGGNVIKVDLGRLAWGAYDNQGNLIRTGRASGGKSYCADIRRSCRTITGTYTIYSKKGPGCKSSRFPVGRGGAPMPYCMHFKGGYALHGGNVPNYNASHGCIRLHHADAQWLNQNFVRVGSTRVSIHY